MCDTYQSRVPLVWCFTFPNGACYQYKTLLFDITPCWITVLGASCG